MPSKLKFNRATHTLVLRSCSSTLTSKDGFQYPEKGLVTAPDFQLTHECGQGLHGFARGIGDGSLANHDPDSKWLILAVPTKSLIDLTGKVKFRQGRVLFVGTRFEAANLIKAEYPDAPVIGCVTAVGDKGTASAGDYGTASAGDGGTATAGDRGTATAGNRGTATAGDRGTASAGDGGTATAGYEGTATAGDYGTATAGYWGTATAGVGGTLMIRRFDGNRYRVSVGYVGEDGILPNTEYRLDDKGKFIPADSQTV